MLEVADRDTYALTEDEHATAKLVAKRRNTMNGGQSNIPGGETSSVTQREDTHYRAIVAEIAVSRIFNLAWTGCGKGSYGAFDVGNMLEVRSIDNPSKNLMVRPADAAKRGSPIVLALVQPPDAIRVSLLGWQFVGDAIDSGTPMDQKTTRPYWIVQRHKLRHLDELRAYVLEWIWSNN